MSLENKVVLVTGAGFPNGIGAGVARCFANEKAKVVITDLDGAPIDETAAGMPGTSPAYSRMLPAKMRWARQQIRSSSSMAVSMCWSTMREPPPPKIPENLPSSEIMNPGMSDQIWDMQLVTNLRTTYASTMAVTPKMEDGGSIVNIASVAALGPSGGLVAYGAAKAAVVHLTKTHAIQFAPRKIRANCICPGLLYTRAWEMMTANMKATNPALKDVSQREIFLNVVAQSTPLGEEQTPEDIGNLAVFYASDRARMITGAVVAVDGGSSVR